MIQTCRAVRYTFERVLSPTRMTVGIHDGVGCCPDKLPESKRTPAVIPDDFAHELATCFNDKGRGPVVLTSCSHRGVVNTVKRAMDVSGVRKVHAVVGGFHLAPHKEEHVRETVAALREINPDCIIPLHCTGEVFIDIVQREMPNQFIRSYTGTAVPSGLCPRTSWRTSDAESRAPPRSRTVDCPAN